jgi:hypothetical protein
MPATREKFATQIDAELLKAVRERAEIEGRKIQSIVEEALRRHLADPQPTATLRARPHVMRAFEESTERFSGLYDRLSK